MKKFNLRINEPCHENWEQMSPAERGRFCGSCQKTVVDFTTMSDRQIAAFFAKPVSSVCGRFYNDQLNRALEVPKKKIPWVRYFFRFTWPAFVFFLKSCTNNTTTGEVKQHIEQPLDAQNRIGDSMYGDLLSVTMGSPIFIPDTVPIALPQENTCPLVDEPEMIIGDIEISEVESKPAVPADSVIEVTQMMEPVVVVAYPVTRCVSITMGAVTKITGDSVDSVVGKGTIAAPPVRDHSVIAVYPNPVARGQSLTISMHEPFSGSFRLLTSSGQSVDGGPFNRNKGEQVQYTLPSVAKGMYFLVLENAVTKKLVTERIIVQ